MKAIVWALACACLLAALPMSDTAAPARSAREASMAEWSARARGAIEHEEYLARPTRQGLQAPNRAQNLRTWFRSEGIEVVPRKADRREWSFRWRTEAWGRAGRMQPAGHVAPEAKGARVEYRRPGMVEWYENQNGGVEQGFTLETRPPGAGPLRVEGRTACGLRARAEAGGEAVSFVDGSGSLVLRYGGLAAWDAHGKKLTARLRVTNGSLSIEVDDREASYPLTIDPLLTAASWTAESNQAAATLGYSVASAGDVNGDGFSDVVIGAPRFDNGEGDEGRAYVFHGSAMGLQFTAARFVEGGQDSALFGYSVASAGDVNGDGYSDVIVGASSYDGGQSNEGRACVYYGSASGISVSPAWTAEGNQDNAWFGSAVARAGDVNGDGYADVIVAAYGYDNGQADEGRAFVYHGSASGLSASPAWTGECNQVGAAFGYSVSSAGDVNKDGYGDVIIGARWFDNGQDYEGRAFVYHGSASGLAPSPAWTAEGNQINALFGHSVGTAGDVNADGYSDVIIGAPLQSNGQSEEGRAYVYAGSASGLAASPIWTAELDQTHAGFGVAVGGAGDVNGDGYSDIVIGAYAFDGGHTDEGRAMVYYGSATGPRPGPAWTAEGDQAGAYFGYSVATAGDVNGDGYSDVLVGAYGYDNGQGDEGRAFAFQGAATGLFIAGAWTAESNQAHTHFGFSAATVGDVNGDGYTDVIVGSPWYDNGQGDEGRAFVYLGSATGVRLAAAWTAECDQDSALFAYSVASAGDVNGDGYGDVVVGAYQYDDGETDEGRAYLYLGSAAGLAATPAWTAQGDQTDSRFGYSVASAGDVNGDGYSDVLVAAHRYDNGSIDEGRAHLYLGSASGLGATPAWTAEGNQGGADFGNSVASAGDVNGDGFDDVIIGSRSYDHGENNEGRAFVYLGSAAGLSATPAWTGESDQPDARFGYSVASAGDVNGDGFSDVIVGAYLYDDGEVDEGRAYVFYGSASGPSPTPGWTAEGDQAGAFFGCSVARAGDVNRDGLSDIIVGAYGYDHGETDEGQAFLYRGSPYGPGLNPAWTAEGNQANGFFGWSVGSAGDINRDNFSDVIIGAHKFDSGSDNEGRAYVYWDLRTGGATTDVLWQAGQTGGGLRFASIYPNPARSQSMMHYVLPKAGPVRLSIHDVLGRRIALLADRPEEAGTHSATWEGRDAAGAAVPAGVYFARLESGGESAARIIVRR